MTIILSDPEYVLRGVSGPVFGRHYRLLSPTVIGRAAESDISIGEAGLSRAHARLRPTLDGLEIEDLRSTNGTFLNGQRVTSAIARPGDEIAFDRLRFQVDDGSARTTARPRAALKESGHAVPDMRLGRSLLIGLAVAAAVAVVAFCWADLLG